MLFMRCSMRPRYIVIAVHPVAALHIGAANPLRQLDSRRMGSAFNSEDLKGFARVSQVRNFMDEFSGALEHEVVHARMLSPYASEA